MEVHRFGYKEKQFKTLKELMNRADVSEVVNACDAGREGELIFRFVYDGGLQETYAPPLDFFYGGQRNQRGLFPSEDGEEYARSLLPHYAGQRLTGYWYQCHPPFLFLYNHP